MNNKLNKNNIAYFENVLHQHTKVTDFQIIDDYLYLINRKGLDSQIVVITSNYLIDQAACDEILLEYPSINCIVNLDPYQRSTPEVKAYLLNLNIGLFNSKELMGALHKNGREFINYTPPKTNKISNK